MIEGWVHPLPGWPSYSHHFFVTVANTFIKKEIKYKTHHHKRKGMEKVQERCTTSNPDYKIATQGTNLTTPCFANTSDVELAYLTSRWKVTLIAADNFLISLK